MPQGMIKKDDCILLVLDIQGTLFETMVEKERMLTASLKMIDFARRVDIPIVATEQYPKGLGPSLPEILEALPEGIEVIPKTTFSCFGEPKFDATIRSLNRKTIIVVGMETHICVNQTVLDLIEHGFQAHVVEDAVRCRWENSHRIAIEKMRQAGAIICDWEMAAYELTYGAKTAEFKQLLDLMKRAAAENEAEAKVG